ncbi:MAG: c-type cytochrome [Acidobacteriota bacterium]
MMLTLLVVGGALTGAGCRQDMHDNPRYEPYEVGSHREIPEGTVARGALDTNPAAPKVAQAAAAPTPMASPATPALPGATPAPVAAIPVGEDGFPFKVTKEILDRGQNRFNISCLPCHGALGDGNGMIALRGIRRPPSYHDERLRKAPTSYYYDVITNGFGAMSNYADQLTPEDRWKVIAYIRVLQLSQRADGSQLSESDRRKLEEAEHASKTTEGHQTAGGHSNQ